MDLKWEQEKFKKELIAGLVENGELVGKYVEGQAKRRIQAIGDPDWGKAYRGLVGRLIDSEVKVESRAVVIRVGVRVYQTRYHGYYIELGTAKRAAHPFLRPAVFDNGKRIGRLLVGG